LWGYPGRCWDRRRRGRLSALETLVRYGLMARFSLLPSMRGVRGNLLGKLEDPPLPAKGGLTDLL